MLSKLAAVGEFELKAKDIEGVNNRFPDLLSRWDLDAKYSREFLKIFVGIEVYVNHNVFKIEEQW